MEPKTDGILKNQSDHLRVYARTICRGGCSGQVGSAMWN